MKNRLKSYLINGGEMPPGISFNLKLRNYIKKFSKNMG